MDLSAYDDLPLPTVFVEGEHVAYANAAVAALLGLPLDEIVGRRYVELVAPADRERIEDRQRRRLAGEQVPTVYEAELRGAGGAAIPVEMRVSLRGRQGVVQIVDRRDESRRRELLAALARLGAGVQRELSAEAVQRAVSDGLFSLGIRSVWTVPRGSQVRVGRVVMGPGELAALEAAMGEPLEGLARPLVPLAEQVWREGSAFADDWPVEVERWFGRPIAEPLRALSPDGAYRHAIGLRIDVVGSESALLFAVGGWLRPDDLPAFQLFGSQVSAALEAARTVAELRARNADLDALHLLTDAAAFAPDLDGFLARAEDVVRDATGCNAFVVLLVDHDRREASVSWASRVDPALRAGLGRVPLDGPVLAPVIGEGRTVVWGPDDLPPEVGEALRGAGVSTAVAVPLRFRSGLLGLLVVDFQGPPRDAAACRVDLLQAMATHFAAAIESHRLLDDLRHRVAELTLLNDIAVATGALDPVLLLDNALRRIAATLRAEIAAAYLSRDGRLELAAAIGVTGEQLAEAPSPERGFQHVAASSQQPVRAPGGPWDDARRRWFRQTLGVEASLGVPLLAKERTLGSIVLGRKRGDPFDDAEVRLLSAVGVQLGMAVENARLFADTQRRIGDLEAVNSLALRVFTTAPGDSSQLLQATCREIAAALDAEAAVILRATDDGARLVGVAGWGTPLPAPQLVLDLARTPVAAEALRGQEPAWAPDVVLEPPGATGAVPPLSLLFVPLTSRSATRGLVAIADAPSRRYGEAEVALAYALASEAAMGLENAELYAGERRRVEELSRLAEENARLYEDLRRSYAELARAQEQLIQQERLAALGQLAAVVAHEVRNPLGVIFNSLGTIRRLVQPQGDAKMLLDIVGEEADRLNRIVGDLLDFARPSTPRLRPERLDRVLDDAAGAALAEAGGRVRLAREVPGELPAVPMDARLMRQALLNVMVNAVQAMPEGGTLSVSAREDAGGVRVEIADTGAGIPEEVRHRIFEPFFTTRPTGTGLGLAVVKRILDDHRASVRVESVEHGGTRFVLRFPIETAGVENAPPPWSR